MPLPLAGCLVSTYIPITFDSSATAQPGCLICGGFTFSCNTGGAFEPTNPTFNDTSKGTFVSLSAFLTSANQISVEQGLVTLTINNAAQGTFMTDMYTIDGCGTAQGSCDLLGLVPAVPQTGYRVGGRNTFSLDGFAICFSSLELTVTTNICA